MPQTLSRVLIHMVFSTKDREPILLPPVRDELHLYMKGILNAIECTSLQVGGTEDHVHMLYCLSRSLAIKDVVLKVKPGSSKWIKSKGPEYSNFHWQAGYSTFSVSHSLSDTVIEYIQNQEDHHLKRTFQEEYRLFLEKHELKYDEKYLWD